jgi:hypothetical protein
VGIIFAVAGFLVGVVTAMLAVVLATGSGRGWIKRDLLHRPVVRALATAFAMVLGAMVAMFAYSLVG